MSNRSTSMSAGPVSGMVAPLPGTLSEPAGDEKPRVRHSDPVLFTQYRRLAHKHLKRAFGRLVAEQTGLKLQVAWADAGTQELGVGMRPTDRSPYCQAARSCGSGRRRCSVCGMARLRQAITSRNCGVFFECRQGVFNYWIPVRVRGVVLAIAYLQALDVGREVGVARAGRLPPDLVTRAEFRRAGRLLRWVMSHLRALGLAELRKVELSRAGRTIIALEREQARLRGIVERQLPAAAKVGRRPGSRTHGEAAIRELLEWISSEFSGPVTLRGYAARLGMNAAYLSDLFSRSVGVSFRTYLTQMRIIKSQALLGDFGQTVSEVSRAVGYMNENRFRVMFKKATGLAPRVWRATLRSDG